MAAPTPQLISSTDGVQVAVHELGGTGPLMIFSHATGFCAGVWLPVAATVGRQYRCIGVDYRGHGHAVTPAAAPMSWSGMADDLLAVIDAYAPDAPTRVCGHSMGGAVITLAARRRPGAFRRAWGFEPILLPEPTDASTDESSNVLAIAARRRRATFASRAEALARYEARPPLNLLDPRALQAYIDYGFVDLDDGTVALRCTPEREAQTFENSRSGALEAAGEIEFDYRVLVSGDGGPPARMAEHAAAVHPRLHLARYRQLTHFGPLEAPELIGADILEWFGAEESAEA